MLTNCSNCLGKGFVIDPLEQKQDGLCETCMGSGHTDIDHKCMCGRPAVRLTADTLTCLNPGCVNRALGSQKKDDTIQNLDDFKGYYSSMIEGGAYTGV